MNKFKPGGRCGGDSGACEKENPSGVTSSYSALLAARDAQDRSFATPALKQMFDNSQPQQQAIILAKKPAMDKQKIMDTILQGDMSD
jgi:hypothetical protein